MNIQVSLRRVAGYLRSFLMYRSNPLRARQMRGLYSRFIGRNDLCFDIGSHIGSHVALWLKLGARVVAVEPHPGCVAILRRLYGGNPRVAIVPMAAGGEPGRIVLHVSRFSPTLSTCFPEWMEQVKEDPGFSRASWEERHVVPATTLDSLIAAFGIPAFCKIDVEGGELSVLEGLSCPLRALSFEYIAVVMDRAVSCMERLESLGDYEFNWMPGEGRPLGSPWWLSAGGMKGRLGELKLRGGSGDIFARQRPWQGQA